MQRIIIIALVLAIVAAFMVTYVVRFYEQAVVTTFGKADASSVITTPGLRFKLPWIQNVTTYDIRARFIQSDQETQQTLDKSQVLVTSFLVWKVSDPLKFFQRFSGSGDTPRDHYREAERILKAKLRSASAEVSRFAASELLSASESGSRLGQLEQDMLKSLKSTASGEAALAEYGIEPVSVGISGMGLPGDTSRQVFEHMKAARLRIANEIVSRGESEANAIRATAESDAKKIAAFADALANDIRSRGMIEASKFLATMKENPELAVFMQNIDFIRRGGIGRGTTLVIPTSLPGFEMFRPDATSRFKSGKIPGPGADDLMKPRIGAGDPATPAPAGAHAGEGANR